MRRKRRVKMARNDYAFARICRKVCRTAIVIEGELKSVGSVSQSISQVICTRVACMITSRYITLYPNQTLTFKPFSKGEE